MEVFQMRKVIAYIRVSSDEQVNEGQSLGDQRAQIEKYVEYKQLGDLEVLMDEGKSGADWQRQGAVELLKRIKENSIDHLVITRLPRLGRTALELHKMFDMLDRQGIALHILSLGIDTTTTTGKLVRGVLAQVAEFELDQLKERTRAALAHKKTKGEHMGRIPFGFKLPTKIVDGVVVREKYLIEDPEQMEIIQKAKKMMSRGKSLRATASYFGIPKDTLRRVVAYKDIRNLKAKYLKSRG
jgi:DNA invertase Pin-like site-specific DNA recombinase